MKVANIEALREETMKALNEEFGLNLVPCAVEYDHVIGDLRQTISYDYALLNDPFRASFIIIFTEDYLFFRQGEENHTYIDYYELKNKAQYFMRMAVTVNNIIERG